MHIVNKIRLFLKLPVFDKSNKNSQPIEVAFYQKISINNSMEKS